MLVIFGFIISFVVLIYGVLNNIYIGYCLLISIFIFGPISLIKGNSFRKVSMDAWNGGKRAFIVARVFVLIGLVTAAWMLSGTIPSIVYYITEIIHPTFFILFCFLASSAVSYMLGTSTGTASTIGVVLIIMARGGSININLAAGAILSGCYFGDRVSPMSSCANLLANQTDVELYPMLKNLMNTTIVPFILSCLIYLALSFSNPLTMAGNSIGTDIKENFVVNFIVLIPAIVMLVLSSFKVNVKKSLAVSIFVGVIIALTVQKESFSSIVEALIFGFKLPPSNPLSNLIKGGGLSSIVKIVFAVFVSCSMAGILEGMELFDKISQLFSKFNTSVKLFIACAITSIVTGCFGGNQSISIVMTSQIMKITYSKNGETNYNLATDISNTAVLFAAMIPWNIAVFVPAEVLSVKSGQIIPYAFYLYIPFIVNLINKKILGKKRVIKAV